MAYDDTDNTTDDRDRPQQVARADMPVPPPPQSATDALALGGSDALKLGAEPAVAPHPPAKPGEDERAKEARADIAKKFEDYQKRLDPLLTQQEQGMAADIAERRQNQPHLGKVRQPPPQDLGQNANQWLMAASVLGGLVGLASRRSSINALSAFSGALDGLAAGDKMRFDANYQHWKAASDATIENNNIEMERYEAIIKRQDLDQRQRSSMIEIEGARMHNEFIRQVAAEAARRGDDSMLMAAVDAQQGQMAQYAIAQERMKQQYDERLAIERARQQLRFPQESDEAINQRVQLGLAGLFQQMWKGISVAGPDRTRLQNAFATAAQQKWGDRAAEMIAKANAAYQGDVSAARAAGTIETRVKFATSELASTLPYAWQAADRLPQGNFRSFNAFKQAAEHEFSDPRFGTFTEYNQAVKRAYAKALNPFGVGSVEAMKRADDILDIATSSRSYKAQLQAILDDVNASYDAASWTRDQEPPPHLTMEELLRRAGPIAPIPPPAGRAAPQQKPGTTVPSGFQGRTATNPETGEKMREVAPGQWEPVPGPRSEAEPGGNSMFAAIGARQAPDGEWYVTDPNRPGKYMQVSAGADESSDQEAEYGEA